jgi:hypothetical protein
MQLPRQNAPFSFSVRKILSKRKKSREVGCGGHGLGFKDFLHFVGQERRPDLRDSLKQHRAQTYEGRTLFHGHLKVVAHTHGQMLHSMRRFQHFSQAVAPLS